MVKNRRTSKFKPKKNVKAVDRDDGPSTIPAKAPAARKRVSTGFPTLDGYTSDAEPEPSNERKFIGKKKKSGGFQSMGLSRNVFGGILKKGYKVPTPIQRKCIPVIMEGKDVVAMARTGSGKTAAFLIPMLERLRRPSHGQGCRALILSPTRELAIQTLKFTKELGKLCRLKAELILGGDSLEEQFAALHTFPDIVIATPGRLLHVMIEMDMKLGAVEYLVFDEADRLFEMGFAEQLQEILHRVPENRQTLLFSATLPKSLVEFARAGLHDPTLIRLDVDNKISPDLQMAYFYTRSSDKAAVLLYLLKNVIQPGELTVIFLATRHHIEYMREILEAFDISYTFIFSALDSSARKINLAKFASKKTHILLVTDVAARGIDIPMLDNVINYNFPGKPKLFVHRVGRVARAGRTGTAYSIICPDETPYFIDLHLFLGRPLKISKKHYEKGEDGVIGNVPQDIVDEEEEHLRYHHEHSSALISLRKVCDNAMQMYLRSRPAPSSASIKRSKEINMAHLLSHPMFGCSSSENPQVNLADQMKKYKPNSTIFEINSTSKNVSKTVMLKKRVKHSDYIKKARQLAEERDQEVERMPVIPMSDVNMKHAEELFSKVTEPGQTSGRSGFTLTKSGKQLPNSSHKDEEFYIPHIAPDHRTEMGLSVNSFGQQASEDILDLTQDDSSLMYKNHQKTKWDRKRKRFVGSGGKEKVKKIKTESGSYISASYKKHLYQDWLERSKEQGVNFDKLASEFTAKDEDDQEDDGRTGVRSSGFRSRYRHNKGVEKGSGEVVDEVRTNEVILKGRKKMDRNRNKNKPKEGKKGGKKRKVRRDRYGAAAPLVYSGMNSGMKKKAKYGRAGEGTKSGGRKR